MPVCFLRFLCAVHRSHKNSSSFFTGDDFQSLSPLSVKDKNKTCGFRLTESWNVWNFKRVRDSWCIKLWLIQPIQHEHTQTIYITKITQGWRKKNNLFQQMMTLDGDGFVSSRSCSQVVPQRLQQIWLGSSTFTIIVAHLHKFICLKREFLYKNLHNVYTKCITPKIKLWHKDRNFTQCWDRCVLHLKGVLFTHVH